MSSATPEETGRKRVRFTENEAEKHATIAPSNKAKEVFSTSVVSLLPAIRTLAEYFFQKFLKLQISILQLSTKKEKMLQSATVPRSARSNFKLTTKESESEARQQLNTNVATCIEQYQKALKDNIIASMDLDLQSLRELVKSTLCDALYQLVKIYLILQFTKEDIAAEYIHPQVINIIRTEQRIVHYVFNSFDEFSTYYRNKHSITAMDTVDEEDGTDISVLANNSETPITFNSRHFARNRAVVSRASSVSTASSTADTNQNNNQYILSADNNHIIKQLLYRTFNQSWAAYKHEHDLRITNALLTKYSTTVISTAVTNETAAIVNSEPSVDPKLLKDIITEEVNKATKNLKQQLISLKQSNKRTSKNSNGGDNNNNKTNGRAQKKKTKNSSSKKTTNPSNNKQNKSRKTPNSKKNSKNTKNNAQNPPNSKKKRNDARADANDRGSRNGVKKRNSNKKNPTTQQKRRTTRTS
jgi:hypothetical protein